MASEPPHIPRTKVTAIQAAADKIMEMFDRETSNASNLSTSTLLPSLRRAEAEVNRLNALLDSMNAALAAAGMSFKDSQIWFGPPWTSHLRETSHDPHDLIPARRLNEVIFQYGAQSSQFEGLESSPSVSSTSNVNPNTQGQSAEPSLPVPSVVAGTIPALTPESISATQKLPVKLAVSGDATPPALRTDTATSNARPTQTGQTGSGSEEPVSSSRSPRTAREASAPKKPMSPFKSAALASVLPTAISPPGQSKKRTSMPPATEGDTKRLKQDLEQSTPPAADG